MKKIKVIFDFDSKKWNHTTEEFDNDLQSEIEFSITSKDTYTNIKGTQWGYTVAQEHKQIVHESFPPENVQYELVSSSPIHTKVFETKSDKTYKFEFWLRTDSNQINYEFEVTIPKPPKPFPSWIWVEDTQEWTSPKGRAAWGAWRWDEEIQEWVEELATPQINPGPDYEVE